MSVRIIKYMPYVPQWGVGKGDGVHTSSLSKLFVTFLEKNKVHANLQNMKEPSRTTLASLLQAGPPSRTLDKWVPNFKYNSVLIMEHIK